MTTTTETAWSAVPLSEEQQGLLYQQQMEPDSPRYHVPLAFELTGELDVPALRRALAALVRKHPLLTAIPGDAILHADPARPIPLVHKEVFGLPGDAAGELLRSEAWAPLDLDGAGASRAVLLTVAPDRHYLLVVAHHVVVDGESSGVITSDLWRFYTAERSGTTVPYPPTAPEVYTETLHARRERLVTDGDRLRSYWREVLTDTDALVQLPSDGPVADPSSAAVPLELPVEPVAAFARRHRVGVFAVLLSAYQRTLTRYARQQRVAVAVPASTRSDLRLDGVVGYFVNTVPVRSPLGDEQNAADYVRTVQAELARALDHSALPHPRIAELADESSFNCLFTYQSWYEQSAFAEAVPGLDIRLLEDICQPVVGDLTLEMLTDGDRLRGRLRYSTSRFAAKTATALAAQIVSTVDAMVRHADVPVGLLPGAALQPDHTPCDFPRNADTDQLIRDAAHRFGEHVALQEGERRWTYSQLDAEVSLLAAGLRARGVNPGDTVGVWLTRCAEQVLAVLAVMRAGAVFVPLDPAHPQQRLDDIARRARLTLVIRHPSDWPTPAGLPGIALADLAGEYPPIVPERRSDQPAYVLFTSGSTGVPKGVVVGHRAFVNHLEWSRRYFAVTPDDAMAFTGTLSFDVTLHQLFVPLVCGARLVVVPDGEQRDPEAMAETLRRNGATLLHVVPALLRLLVDTPAFAAVRTLRAVVSAGEALTNHLRRAFEKVQSATLYNAYGPTEATVYATVFDAGAAAGQRWTGQADVPIGDALDNVRCHVLDERLRPVPPGAPGELCLAGEALALGYHDDPERTAQQFCEVEISGLVERIYRTGDLVRALPSGRLSYLGRLDHQVKLNGFRVELGEVEAAMLDAPGIAEAVAVVRGHTDGHGQLIGYVRPSAVDTTAVRSAVAARLPGYMVPLHIVALPDFPRLPSGKTNRNALPEPAAHPATVPVQTPSPVAGRALELVRTAWAEVLGSLLASDDAHFFESGGDSILAMRLVSALRRTGAAVTVRDLHQHPVLSDLAASLDTGPGPSTAHDLPMPEKTTPALAPIQSWFFDTVRTDRHHWNQSVLLETLRPVDPTVLGMAVQAVVLAHPMLSARVAQDRRIEELPPFTACAPRDVFDSIEIDSAAERDRVIRESQRSLDPEAGIMIRARHLRDTASGVDLLLVVIHHLVVDGVSWRVLLNDLDRAVAALDQGELPRLPAEAQSYRSWLAELPAVAANETAVAYWRAVARRRHAADTLLRTAPAGVEGDTRRAEVALDDNTTAALLGRLPAVLDMPVHDVLTGLAALALARWRGCSQVTFDVETHGRQTARGDVSRTVGWFTVLHPLVLPVDRGLAPAAHLRAVRQELAAVPDGGVGFGACRELGSAAAEADLAALPPALVSFNYLGRIDSDAAGSWFRVADAAVPEERSPRAERTHGIELYGLVRDGRLRLGAAWAPSEVDGVDERTVAALVDQLESVIDALVADGVDKSEEVPLNSQQYGILVDSLARQGSGRYIEQMGWVWHGPLDLERFAEAWRHTTRRHAALRAAFAWDRAPRLVVHPEVEPEIRVHADLSFEQLLAQDRDRGFDLSQPGLFRLTVVAEEDRHRVLLSFHHALLDGWSTAVVLEDFYLAYLGHPRPVETTTPDVRTHHRWLAAQNTTDAEDFWSSSLCGKDPAIRSGIVGEVTAETGVGRTALRVPLSDLTAARLGAARQAATESTLFQTLWALLLWRFAGGNRARQVSFGLTLSGRGIDLPGVERLAGLLMTTLPLTVEVRPEEPVLELVRRVRQAALEVSAFEWASTGQVHDWSGRRGTDPLFESLLVVENYPSTLGEVGQLLAEAGVRVEQPTVVGAQTAYPCTLLLHHEADELVLTIVHDRVVVPTEAAHRIISLWRRLLTRLDDLNGRTVAELVADLADEELPVVAARPTARTEATTASWPESPRAAIVREVWQQVLGVDEVRPADHFFASGGHSLTASRFLREISERCGVPARLDDLLRHPTAAGFAAALAGQRTEPAETSPLVALRPGLDPVIYLIHPPGGHVACYAEFARHYDGPEAVVGIRDPRLDEPGTPQERTVRELAEDYHALLATRIGDGPVVLGGFSGGGVIAHELARLIQADTGRAPLVVLIDAAAPSGQVTDTEAEGSFLRQVMAHDRTPREESTPDTPTSGAEYLDELATVAEWMSDSGQADPYVLLATTLAAVERHRPLPFHGSAVVLRAADTDYGGDTDYDAAADYYRSPALGWEGLCEALSVHVVSGNHVSLMTGENARELASVVADLVRRHREGV